MKKINDIISEGSYKDSMSMRRIFNSQCSPQKFKEIFIEGAKSRLYGNEFLVDNDNKEAINQLYYFLVGSKEFNGELNKGIILMGSIGNGKTVLMESFIDVFNETSGKIVTCIHSKDIARINTDNPVGYLNKRPLFIDDIGKEQESIKTYGTIVKPMEDLINERYKNFGLTFATANYKYDDMSYSNHTIDRMKQMFNIIILPGNSRRK
ncbi:hypothetical protein KAR91_00330 [Candidatus Pacearchaeota archaeon]|nr:hypothetical protein [Candidatus Pacearchaeota archaeon]